MQSPILSQLPESTLLLGLADNLIVERVLSSLGEPYNSTSTIQLRELFSFPGISRLPLRSIKFGEGPDEPLDGPASLDLWSRELAKLTEGLFSTLSTTEMVLKDTIARQMQIAAIDERDLTKSDSQISLPNLPPAPAKDLLRLDLQLITAMQNSLKDPQFADYMKHRNLKVDAAQLYKDLDYESRQMKYWASQLGGSNEHQSTTPETQAAMVFNLVRIARYLSESNNESRGAYPSFIVRNNGALTTYIHA